MIQQLDGKACIFPQISHKRCKMVWKHLILNQIASGSVNTLRQNKHKFTVETFGAIISAFRGILWLQCIPDSCTTMQCSNPAEDLCCVIFPSMLPCLMKGGKKSPQNNLKNVLLFSKHPLWALSTDIHFSYIAPACTLQLYSMQNLIIIP